jgi:hypothetical protein
VNRGKVEAYQALGLDLVMGEREGARFRDAFDDRCPGADLAISANESLFASVA